MKNIKIITITLLVLAFVSSCKQHQEARRPISQASGSFMKKSIVRNKKLVATEETQIKDLIKSNKEIIHLSDILL